MINGINEFINTSLQGPFGVSYILAVLALMAILVVTALAMAAICGVIDRIIPTKDNSSMIDDVFNFFDSIEIEEGNKNELQQ